MSVSRGHCERLSGLLGRQMTSEIFAFQMGIALKNSKAEMGNFQFG